MKITGLLSLIKGEFSTFKDRVFRDLFLELGFLLIRDPLGLKTNQILIEHWIIWINNQTEKMSAAILETWCRVSKLTPKDKTTTFQVKLQLSRTRIMIDRWWWFLRAEAKIMSCNQLWFLNSSNIQSEEHSSQPKLTSTLDPPLRVIMSLL